MMYTKKITVFTPTYNRAKLLDKLFKSLSIQSFIDFEWLIVDDGSTDNTELAVNEFKEKSDFTIRYYKKENGGKCSAINYGVKLAYGELFYTVDSDDYLTADALEKISNWYDGIKDKELFCGVSGNLGTSENETPNTVFDSEYIDSSLIDRYSVDINKKIDGERAFIFRTDIQKQYLYPIYYDEKFMTEAVSWNRMAKDGYIMRFYNDIICVYEYQNDGLTSAGNSLFVNNPKGYGLWLKEKAEISGYSKTQTLEMYYSFACELKDIYPIEKIAEYIGCNPKKIKLLLTAQKINRRIKTLKK